MAAVTLEELVKEVGISPESLSQRCSTEHLRSISQFLDWRITAPYLGLKEAEIQAIDEGEKREEVKRLKILEKWKAKFAFKATYKMLVEVLLEVVQADHAEKVCQLLVSKPGCLQYPTATDVSFLKEDNQDISCRSTLPHPTQCYLVHPAEVNTQSVLTCAIRDSEKQPCTALYNVKAKLTSDVNELSMECLTSVQSKHAVCKVKFTPTVRGRHTLRIRVNETDILGSPFAVFATIRPLQLSKPVATLPHCHLKGNASIAVRNSMIYISDSRANKVSIFRKIGERMEKITEFGSEGIKDGQFQYPRGIAVDCHGNVCVVDERNNRIQKFSSDGKFVKVLSQTQLDRPSGIEIGPDKVYVCDSGNVKVRIFGSEWEYASCFGEYEYSGDYGMTKEQKQKESS